MILLVFNTHFFAVSLMKLFTFALVKSGRKISSLVSSMIRELTYSDVAANSGVASGTNRERSSKSTP